LERRNCDWQRCLSNRAFAVDVRSLLRKSRRGTLLAGDQRMQHFANVLVSNRLGVAGMEHAMSDETQASAAISINRASPSINLSRMASRVTNPSSIPRLIPAVRGVCQASTLRHVPRRTQTSSASITGIMSPMPLFSGASRRQGLSRGPQRPHCVAGVVGLELGNPSGTKSI